MNTYMRLLKAKIRRLNEAQSLGSPPPELYPGANRDKDLKEENVRLQKKIDELHIELNLEKLRGIQLCKDIIRVAQ